MLQRTSNIDKLNVMVLSYSSIIQLGDSCIINALSRALAVQREAEIFFGNEGNFPAYTVFYKPIPLPPINETVSFLPHNPNPMIKVKHIDIIGISASSILHVGNSRNVSMEARVKHIRQELPFGHEQDIK
ncbi:spore germination protein GerPE [Bacillus xiapuensis]|uniref:Spore germination protein GerPE n=1 Tax=Bacillus xiapuensis TaxID=2014075 RepID=A0ABU6N7C8_9BACI|nr:spore germination protein GerPE [Bacillus xiapuensis]